SSAAPLLGQAQHCLQAPVVNVEVRVEPQFELIICRVLAERSSCSGADLTEELGDRYVRDFVEGLKKRARDLRSERRPHGVESSNYSSCPLAQKRLGETVAPDAGQVALVLDRLAGAAGVEKDDCAGITQQAQVTPDELGVAEALFLVARVELHLR